MENELLRKNIKRREHSISGSNVVDLLLDNLLGGSLSTVSPPDSVKISTSVHKMVLPEQ